MERLRENVNVRSVCELCKEADALLKENGFTVFGRPKSEVKYLQIKFEYSMQTGAYSSNQSRRK